MNLGDFWAFFGVPQNSPKTPEIGKFPEISRKKGGFPPQGGVNFTPTPREMLLFFLRLIHGTF